MNKRRACVLRFFSPLAYRWFDNHACYRKKIKAWANAIGGCLVFSPLVIIPLGLYLNGQKGALAGLLVVLLGIVPFIVLAVNVSIWFSVEFCVKDDRTSKKLKESGLTKYSNILSSADVWIAHFLPTLEEAARLKHKKLEQSLPPPVCEVKRPRF